MGGENAMEWQNAECKTEGAKKDKKEDISIQTKLQPPKIKYEFENEGQYLVAKYKEQLDFALYQVMSQYQSAKKGKTRKKGCENLWHCTSCHHSDTSTWCSDGNQWRNDVYKTRLCFWIIRMPDCTCRYPFFIICTATLSL